MKNKIVVALDVSTFDQAKKLIDELTGHVGVFKVGKQLFTRLGPTIVEYIKKQGGQVFLDLKFHDIPNTVRGACHAAGDLDVDFLTIHTMGGFEMMRAARQGVIDSGNEKTKVLGVTILTSINQDVLREDLNLKVPLGEQVLHLAKLAQMAGIQGVVASPKEITLIREHTEKDFLIVTPGIRPTWYQKDDQKRTMTPKDAIEAGADYIVIGRPITMAHEPKQAAMDVAKEGK
ncbi:MAG: orotidine-5'-phosphate decarboxylase [bacterium]|nr:orotidine-5'-phosphate decarboxylase [bacterium]MBU1917863.1 orotidine-5'-phosphate decarboxylase [bacterium]